MADGSCAGGHSGPGLCAPSGYDIEEDIMCNDKHSRISQPSKKPLTQQRTGSTIPTIVNGTVTRKPSIKIAKKVL